jgi:predicted TIM-barrel fold metal-dependent hydrolase
LRIDAHQFFTVEHIPEHLAPILKRNKFEGSIAVAGDEAETRRYLEFAERYEFIRGVVGCGGNGHPKFVGEARFEVDTPQAALRLAEQHPGRKIAIVRLGSPPAGGDGAEAWAAAMERAAAHPEIYCKASGLLSLAGHPWKPDGLRPFMQYVLRVFGARRTMFGSGWPEYLPESIWKESLAIFTQCIGAQPIEVREELLGGTALRFYGL